MKKPQDVSPRLTREAKKKPRYHNIRVKTEAHQILYKWIKRYKTVYISEAIMRVEYELNRSREGFIY